MVEAEREHPFVGSYLDRHGRRRWRFRHAGKTVSLPGPPGTPAFDVAYAAALAGRPVKAATVVRLPHAGGPRSLRAAWRQVVESVEWKRLKPATQKSQRAIAERFLLSPVADDTAVTFGEIECADLKRRHVKAVLGRYSATPHAAAHILRLIRRLTGAALDQEWIETDPTYRLRYRPDYVGWRAWTEAERVAFEQRWPIGTTPRLVYCLALYTGQRRSDVARMKWSDIDRDGINVTQQKGGKVLWLPLHPALREALAAAPHGAEGDTILLTQYGRAFSVKALGMRMQDWTRAAGLPPGITLHGLRKTLGKLLAEGGATTRQLMGVLGHDDIAHAELYSRAAEQRRLATDAMHRIAGKPRVIKGGKDPR
jgi:integrase